MFFFSFLARKKVACKNIEKRVKGLSVCVMCQAQRPILSALYKFNQIFPFKLFRQAIVMNIITRRG